MFPLVKPSSLGFTSRVGGPSPRLDHLTVTVPDLWSNWHFNMKAKDLPCAYAHDVELMEKLDLEDYHDGGTMLGKCLTVM